VKLVSLAGAAWGATAAQLAQPGLRAAQTSDEQDALIHELARSIVIEAQKQFSGDPVLAKVWREAANEAACACFSAAGEEAA
jgi:hypothetical protein